MGGVKTNEEGLSACQHLLLLFFLLFFIICIIFSRRYCQPLPHLVPRVALLEWHLSDLLASFSCLSSKKQILKGKKRKSSSTNMVLPAV